MLFISKQLSILLIVVLANIILTALVYWRDRRNFINILFAFLGLITSIWLLLMFISVQPMMPAYSLLFIRATIFIASPMSMLFYWLAYFFSCVNKKMNKSVLWYSTVVTVFNMAIAFTSLVFRRIDIVNGLAKPVPGLGMVFFATVSTFFSVGAVYLLLRAYFRSTGVVRQQLWFIMIGVLSMLGLIILTVLFPVVAFGNSMFVSYTPIYVFIFLAMTGIAILKYRLFNLKILATEALVVVLIVVLIIEAFTAVSLLQTLFKLGFAALVAVIGVLLVRSVKKEIRQREELTELTSSLEQANVRLREIDKQKTDFLSIAAHQLRTPLSVLNGYIELISDGGYGKVGTKVKEILKNMDDSNQRLIKLVDEFLDITRIEQGRTKFDFATRDMSTVIDSAVQELKDRAEQKGLRIVWRVNQNISPIIMDDDKVRHVIFNFIDNAIKYSDKGVISLAIAEDKAGVAVRVKDNGFGFDKIDEANFFQKFYRGNNVKGTNVNGTGLGLYVCRMFIEAHHGRIWAHSEGLGKGSEFGFWIPRES